MTPQRMPLNIQKAPQRVLISICQQLLSFSLPQRFWKFSAETFLVLSLCSSEAFANFKPDLELERFEREFDQGQFVHMAERTEAALETMLRLAHSELWKRGYPDEAERMIYEWREFWAGYLPMIVMLEGLGDHAPLSVWLAEWYDRIESMLGPATMRLLHLDDIEVLNYSIPVVFHLKQISEPVDLPEYGVHWIPFTGSVAYWSVLLSCEIVTSGSGWRLVCNPGATAGEFAMIKLIAPRYTERAYAHFYLQR